MDTSLATVSAEAGSEGAPLHSSLLTPHSPPAHILVVDDEPHVARIIQIKLEQGPFRVTIAQDGLEALDALEREQDLKMVWLDIMMPHVSGLEVLARMRASERTRALPCVILTAAGHAEQRERAMLLGATDFMTKPFSPKRLLSRTAELVGIDLQAGN